ncbi:copper resistance protein CopC [Streptomyces sp. MNU76]|uniref:copper resistance CopC/CopD family protein n=1 Tax=Streptomyces sp. MNU76 TaxID=2560026 RepID=UPI001E4AF248|nr:copper resistance protein CopC [Streptomyces sp. MNU76]MCC9710913.1 copper resistance protein CopC [Streptomyces sp. MNU76]
MKRQHTHHVRRMGRALLVMAAVLVPTLLCGATPASAHAVLTGSDPREGTVLKTAPKQVTVSFSESVALTEDSVRVLDPDSRPVTAGDPERAQGRADTARVPLTDGLEQGTYTVSWRVLSEDSHAISGAFTFSIGAPSTNRAETAAEPAVDPTVDVLYGIGRYVAYGGLALLIGVAVFALVCRPGSPRKVHGPFLAGWWALTLSTTALLLLRGPYASGDGAAGVFDPQLLRDTVVSRPGVALMVRLALLLLIALLLKHGRPEAPAARRTVTAGITLALALAATWAAAEHASTGIQVPVAMASAVLHLLAMSVWLGGLAALLVTLYRTSADDPLRPDVVARFSRLALGAVGVLATTGVYQSWRGIGSWDAFTTPYGRALALKTGAVILMLTAASYSRKWTARLSHTPRERPVLVNAGGGAPGPLTDRPPKDEPGAGADPAGSGSERQRQGLRRSVLAEIVVGVVVLAVTTVLTGSQPGRAATEAAKTSAVSGQPDVNLTVVPFDTGAPAARGRVQITLEPGRVGRNVVEAVVFGADGGLIAIPELRLTFTQSENRVGPLDAELVDQSGYWGSDTLDLPLAGTWTVRATVRVSDIDQVTVSGTVEITP